MKLPLIAAYLLSAALIGLTNTATTEEAKADSKQQLAASDDEPADLSQPVQVYILLGQSNMLGFGKIGAADKPGSLAHAVKEKKLYSYLIDDAGNWTVRKDVRNVRVMGSGGPGNMKVFNNEWMAIKGRAVGPEIGIGHHVGDVTDAPVLILKSCIGNRSLGWDLLPPGSQSFEVEENGKVWHYGGYKESPLRWEKGTEPKPMGWYAGVQYDGDIARAKEVLAELDKYCPDAKEYEVAGFFFWQGDKDRYNAVHASRYEENLVRLVRQLRKDFEAPNAKFVCATLGQTKKGAKGNEGLILEAQLAVDGKTGKYPEFNGNVATVYSNPLSKGGASNGHYGGNAETYMNIGEAMGRAMVGLLNGPIRKALEAKLAQAKDPASQTALCRKLVRDNPEDYFMQTFCLRRLASLPGTEISGDLLAALGSPNSWVRQVARELAAKLPGEAATQTWLEYLGSAQDGTRPEVLRVLVERGDAKAIPAVRTLLGHDDENTRVAALRALVSLAGAESLSAAADAASDPSPEVREAAYRILASSSAPSATDALLTLARKAKTIEENSLALRHCLSRIATGKVPESDRIAVLEKSLALSRRPEEKRLALPQLRRLATLNALRFAKSLLSDAALREEAADTAVAIAGALKLDDEKTKQAVITIMESVMAQTKNANTRDAAEKLIYKHKQPDLEAADPADMEATDPADLETSDPEF